MADFKLTPAGAYQPESTKEFSTKMFQLLDQFQLAVKEARFRDVKLCHIYAEKLIQEEEMKLRMMGEFLGS